MAFERKMSFRMRTSKYRHVYGSEAKKEQCYEGLQISKNAHEATFCAVNPSYVAVVTEVAGGGSFAVLPIEKTGRVDINVPKVGGHAGPVLDIKWNPFNDSVIASSSDDSTVKLWQIPEGGLEDNLTDWVVDLHGHTRRVGQIEWHPTAANILLSSSYDHSCILWNVEAAEPISVLGGLHEDTIFSLAWDREGSIFSTTCKDKRLRLLDPRHNKTVANVSSHQGNKASRSVFLNNSRLFTIGFSRTYERQYSVWDLKKLSSPLKTDVIDCSSGVIFPFYDPDTNVMFLAGKGDGNIRYYEMVDDAPYAHFLNQYNSGSPQRGLGFMPKRGLDTSRCEIYRFYKLHTVKPVVEPISMIVPRKSEMFQEDIYPPTASAISSLSADEWLAGNNRGPILMSLKDGQILAGPTMQKDSASNPGAPVITTYKAVKRGSPSHTSAAPLSSPTGSDRSADSGAPPRLPASLHNIAKLSGGETAVEGSLIKSSPVVISGVLSPRASSAAHTGSAGFGTGSAGFGIGSGIVVTGVAAGGTTHAPQPEQDVNENSIKHTETVVDVSNRIDMFESKNSATFGGRLARPYNGPISSEISAHVTRPESSATNTAVNTGPIAPATEEKSSPALSTSKTVIVVSRGTAQPLRKQKHSTAQAQSTSTTVVTESRSVKSSLHKTDQAPAPRTSSKQTTKQSSHNTSVSRSPVTNGRAGGGKAVLSSSSSDSEPTRYVPTPASHTAATNPPPARKTHKKKGSNMAYRKRRERQLQQVSSDVSDVFSSPPLSPTTPPALRSLSNRGAVGWSENPLYNQGAAAATQEARRGVGGSKVSADSSKVSAHSRNVAAHSKVYTDSWVPVDISALDDALQDFEELSNRMSGESASRPHTGSSSGAGAPFLSTPDIRLQVGVAGRGSGGVGGRSGGSSSASVLSASLTSIEQRASTTAATTTRLQPPRQSPRQSAERATSARDIHKAEEREARSSCERAVSTRDIRTTVERERDSAERATSARDVRLFEYASQSLKEKIHYSQFSNSAHLSPDIGGGGGTTVVPADKYASKSVENMQKDPKLSIPNNNLSSQCGYDSRKPGVPSLDDIINDLSGKPARSMVHTVSFAAPPPSSPRLGSVSSEKSTEMIDLLSSEAPDDTLLKPSKMRASLRSERRHTTQVNFTVASPKLQQAGSGGDPVSYSSTSTTPLPTSHSPSPAKDIEIRALDSALNMAPGNSSGTSGGTSGFKRSGWQSSSMREGGSRVAGEGEREGFSSAFQRVGSVRDRVKRYPYSSVDQDKDAIKRSIAEFNIKSDKQPTFQPLEIRLAVNPNTYSGSKSVITSSLDSKPDLNSNIYTHKTVIQTNQAERDENRPFERKPSLHFSTQNRTQSSTDAVSAKTSVPRSPDPRSPTSPATPYTHPLRSPSPPTSTTTPYTHPLRSPSPPTSPTTPYTHPLSSPSPPTSPANHVTFTAAAALRSPSAVSSNPALSPSGGSGASYSNYDAGVALPGSGRSLGGGGSRVVSPPQTLTFTTGSAETGDQRSAVNGSHLESRSASRDVINEATSLDDSKIHVKKVWSQRFPVKNDPAPTAYENGESLSIPTTDAELRKAYFRQLEEINSLKEQLSLKDRRIRALEDDMKLLRCGPASVDESTC